MSQSYWWLAPWVCLDTTNGDVGSLAKAASELKGTTGGGWLGVKLSFDLCLKSLKTPTSREISGRKSLYCNSDRFLRFRPNFVFFKGDQHASTSSSSMWLGRTPIGVVFKWINGCFGVRESDPHFLSMLRIQQGYSIFSANFWGLCLLQRAWRLGFVKHTPHECH